MMFHERFLLGMQKAELKKLEPGIRKTHEDSEWNPLREVDERWH